MDKKVRVRFAPSPTGYMHIGGARTTIFNYLFARHHGGSFVLRIEDTDRVRSTKESEEAILRDLRWLGLDWDESVDVGGPYGPYRQSERMDIYRKYAEKLLEEGKAYKCYCTEEELEQRRKEAIAKGLPPKYDGRCRNLTEEERKRFEEEGRKPSLRFKVDETGGDIIVHDLIRGDVSFKRDVIGDFVIMRKDNTPTYNFACVIDDHLMEMTHIIRGEEHLSNTPRQLLIYEALGFEPPKFAHVSMILGPDRTKLSKRHGDTSLEEYRKKGYLPDALFNYLALLGWSPGGDREILGKEELITLFDLSGVVHHAAIFDIDKLNWMNGEYIKKKGDEELFDLLFPYMKNADFVKEIPEGEEKERILGIIRLLKDRIKTLSQFVEYADYFFKDVEIPTELYEKVLKGKDYLPEVLGAIKEALSELKDYNEEEIEKIVRGKADEYGLKGKHVIQPLRVILTGKKVTPGMFEVMRFIGRERVIERIERFIKGWQKG